MKKGTLPRKNVFLLVVLWVSISVSSCAPQPAGNTASPSPSQSPVPTLSPTDAATQTPWVITASPQQTPEPTLDPSGLFFLSLPDGGYFHLFAYSPESLPLTRLTTGPWDDIAPAISPDGTKIAYSSRQNGYWDLYVLDLQTGSSQRLTDTLGSDSSPSWSPDGSWLVTEGYAGQSLEIDIIPADGSLSSAIQLTSDGYLDMSPAWSPLGRQIAFVSDRSGEPEIWIAHLDQASPDKFVNISLAPGTIESHPAWSPDGTRLAWAASDPVSGLSQLMIWDARDPAALPILFAAGNWPVWLDNDTLASNLESPRATQLVSYQVPSRLVSLPPQVLPGSLKGLSYGMTALQVPGVFRSVSAITPAPLYLQGFNTVSTSLPGRTALVDLEGVQAVYPRLSDSADEAFTALRSRVALEAGWDVLANLENAFVPLGTPLDPGLESDWLYTGRAFTISPALVQAGWMVVVREDYGGQTWWRVFIRTIAQDGSMGAPLAQVPWDFSTRTGSSSAYESGGSLMQSIPSGYWLDLTSLAAIFGWERLPALTNWRTYYSGAYFNEFALISGLDWHAAMLQLYPPESLQTATRVIPPTRTPTRTPLYYRSPTPTRTPTPRPTHTP